MKSVQTSDSHRKACSLLSWVVVVLAALCTLHPLPCSAQHGEGDTPHDWTYSGEAGPEHWGDLSPKFATCATGKLQSPIDITSARAAALPPITFSYRPSPLTMIDNGHTIEVSYAAGSTITIGSKLFKLVQFHFHHPSEEKIHGKAFDMTLHLVHRSEDGDLAVVAVLLTVGAGNQLIETLWKNLPTEKGKEFKSDDVTVNAADLLPSDRNYYTFPGSLTTPPCTEGITWYVMQTPVSVSQSQIDTFAKVYPLNARPVQPLNGRVVQSSGR